MKDVNYKQYCSLIKEITFGKKLSDSLYVYNENLDSFQEELSAFIEYIKNSINQSNEYNVLKFFTNEFKISFLNYPDFLKLPHPQLQSSVTINLATGKIRKFNYSKSENPPIIHRKELMLNPEHPDIPKFKALTEAEEAYGLYENTKIIGFKKNWEKLLEERGLSYKGHKLIKLEKVKEIKKKPEVIVQRYKTAIARYDFSKPVKSVLEHNLISEKESFFDYGCGQGGDLKALQNMGINATGWDPEFQPDNDKTLSDVVNLGFVLNIIEDQIERTETLQNAYDLTQKLLIVSCMIATSSNVSQGRPYKDGILTNRGTFQKYFVQNELRQYIEDVLGVTAVAVSPGVFFIFRNPIEQQDFLSKRNKRHINWEELSKKLYPARPERKLKKEIVFEENRELIESFWEQMLELGRIPKPEEFENINELKNKVGSPNFVKKLFLDKFGEDTINEAFEIKRNDLLVYLALSNFKTKVPFKHLSINLQADIKTFVGSYVAAIEESKKLLFSIGNPEIVESLCAETGFGFFDFKALYIHKSLIQDLSPILRIYIGCAGLLYGDLQNADIIKIHKRSGKVTLLRYDDFEAKPLPELLERIKINLRKQKIDVFDHQAGQHQQLLYFKENYVSKDYPARLKWEKYSKKLRKLGFDDNLTIGPSKQEFFQFLEDKGLTVGLNKKRKK